VQLRLITATTAGNLSDLLSVNSKVVVAEAYDYSGNLLEIALDFTNTVAASEYVLYQNEPNPFKEVTTIAYLLPGDSEILPGDSEIELILRDEAGRVLRVIKQDGKAGPNQIQLSELDLPAGFIYYQLNTKFGTKSKKMLRIE